MSLHYILDGYNIIKQIPALSLKGLRDGRDSLSSLVEIYRPQGSLKNFVSIVFDGKSDVISPKKKSSVLEEIFSQDQSADDKIRHMVEKSRRRQEVIVVTDDKELRFSIRLLGAQVCHVKDFLVKSKPGYRDGDLGAGKKKSAKAKEEEKYISKTQEYNITKEFEQIWLKKK